MSNFQRLGIVGGALLFVALSVAVKLFLWEGLRFLLEDSVASNTLSGAVALAVAALAGWLLLRWRPEDGGGMRVACLPNRSDATAFALALAAGVAIFACVYLLVLLTTDLSGPSLRISIGEALVFFLTALLAVALNAAWEEVTFRGWPFVACARAFGPYPTAISLGCLFGVTHLFNPEWTVGAIVSVVFAGWLISFTMLYSKTIYAPIGIHIGWNLTQSMLTSRRVWTFAEGGDTMLTGFGLEATYPGLAVTGAAAAAVTFLFWRRQRKESQAEGV